MEITFDGEKCTLKRGAYANNRIALSVVDSEGFPYCSASVNLVDEPINEGELFLDTNNVPWIYKELYEAGIVSEHIGYGNSGFCVYPKVKLIIDL